MSTLIASSSFEDTPIELLFKVGLLIFDVLKNLTLSQVCHPSFNFNLLLYNSVLTKFSALGFGGVLLVCPHEVEPCFSQLGSKFLKLKRIVKTEVARLKNMKSRDSQTFTWRIYPNYFKCQNWESEVLSKMKLGFNIYIYEHMTNLIGLLVSIHL